MKSPTPNGSVGPRGVSEQTCKELIGRHDQITTNLWQVYYDKAWATQGSLDGARESNPNTEAKKPNQACAY